jgi:hypothetical protein
MRAVVYRRRKVLVDKPFQWSLAAHGVALGLLVLVSVCCGLFAPLLWDLQAGAPNQEVDADLAIVMVYMHERFWLVAGTCLVLATLGAMQLSHRIAGPLVRYKRYLRLLGDGKLPPPLRTRRHDYLKDEVACLNAAVAGLRARHAEIRVAATALAGELACLPAAAGAELPALVERIAVAEARLRQSLLAIREATPDEVAAGSEPQRAALPLAVTVESQHA